MSHDASAATPRLADASLLPLTERVLAALPGPRWLGLTAWAFLPTAGYEIAHLAWDIPSYPGPGLTLSIAWANLVGLLAAERFARRLQELAPDLERLLPPEELAPARHPFRAVGSVAGPLVLTALLVLSFEGLDFVLRPGLDTGFLVVAVALGEIPIAAFLWVYSAVLLGLDRLGRAPLRLRPFVADPSLGLKPFGSLGLQALALVVLATVPSIPWSIQDPRALVVGGAAALAIALFFLSAYRLHLKLELAKAGEVQRARQRVAQAIEPTQTDPSGEVLARQAPEISAAAELERRALAIQDWPFSAAVLRTVAAIATSVVAVILARLVLSRVGL